MIAIAIDTLLHNAQAAIHNGQPALAFYFVSAAEKTAIMAKRENLVSQAKVSAITAARIAVNAFPFN